MAKAMPPANPVVPLLVMLPPLDEVPKSPTASVDACPAAGEEYCQLDAPAAPVMFEPPLPLAPLAKTLNSVDLPPACPGPVPEPTAPPFPPAPITTAVGLGIQPIQIPPPAPPEPDRCVLVPEPSPPQPPPVNTAKT
jgi:hypothetical protein